MRHSRTIRLILVTFLLTLNSACRILVQVPDGGTVETLSGRHQCHAGEQCTIKVRDTTFDEVFIARPDAEHVFEGWKKSHRYLCGGSKTPCALSTAGFAGNPALMDILTSSQAFYLVPRFREANFYQVQGEIHVAPSTRVDSDVNDELAPYKSNDFVELAQAMPNPVTIGGYANLIDEGEPGPSTDFGDLDDFYEIDLVEGQVVSLAVADPDNGDLDLYLYNSAGDIVDFSLETGVFERLVVKRSGRYFVNVYAFSGASNYSLAIGQDSLSQGASLPLRPDFEPGEAVVKLRGEPGGMGEGYESPPGRLELRQLDLSGGFDPDSRGNTVSVDKWQFENPITRRKWQTLSYIKQLRLDPRVEFAEPNYRYYHYEVTPDDEYFGLQQHYQQINLPHAWVETTGDPDVVIAVIDTGVLLEHPDLQGQFVDGYDFISNPLNAADGNGIDDNPDDNGDGGFAGASSFHGTHVAGTIAAASNNGIGVSGVAWRSKIMPLRALGVDGGSSYDLLQAIRFAAGIENDSGRLPQQTATIINMSLGGPGYSQAMQDAILQAREKGVIVVAAAGNEATSTPSYPAAYEGVISVGAVGPGNEVAAYSNFGPHLDLLAPGGDLGNDLDGNGYADGVLSTAADDSNDTFSFNLQFKQGTSMAAPHVSGVIALMKAVNPEISPGDVDRLLREGKLTFDLGEAGWDSRTGWGLIDASQAVSASIDLNAPSQPSAPQLSTSPSNLSLGSEGVLLYVGNAGNGSLEILQIAPADSWLRITPHGVDDSGLGQYLVEVFPGALSPGNYQSSLRVESSVGDSIVPVFIQIPDSILAGSAGVVYALLLNEYAEVVQELSLTPSNGRYRYQFDAVKEGVYTLIAGSDMDSDFYICDAGDACGAYTTVAYPQPLVVDGDLEQVNFTIAFEVAINAAPQAAEDGAATASGRSVRRDGGVGSR